MHLYSFTGESVDQVFDVSILIRQAPVFRKSQYHYAKPKPPGFYYYTCV